MEVAPGGLRYAAAFLALAALGFAVPVVVGLGHVAIGALFLALALGAVLFHRDPDRSVPQSGVVAPADGTVRVLRTEADRVRLGVFMNVHDVHVNRAPVSGHVERVEHTPGAHRPAFTKSSDRNERVTIDLDTDAGPATVTLIAGAFARRIHPYVEQGDDLDRGERIGHISFGSRVDIVFPPAVDLEDVRVGQGERVVAGETVLVDAEVVSAATDRSPSPAVSS